LPPTLASMARLLTEHRLLADELAAYDAELRSWAAEEPGGLDLADHMERAAGFCRVADDLLRDDKAFLQRLVTEVARLTEDDVIAGMSDALHGRSFVGLLMDAQEIRDQDWLTVAKAAEIRCCSATYIRRLARERLDQSDKRRLPDGRWLVRCGAIRQRRKR